MLKPKKPKYLVLKVSKIFAEPKNSPYLPYFSLIAVLKNNFSKKNTKTFLSLYTQIFGFLLHF